MPTITLSIHGGKYCGAYCCPWMMTANADFGAEDYYLGDINRIVVAVDEYGHAAGIWRYYKQGKTITSCGTWVSPKHRKYGIAKRMWEFGISCEDPKKINVTIITDRGYSLIDSMKEQFPDVKWKISEDSLRKLRKLK
jgi:predicted GNAT family acetyltransferase